MGMTAALKALDVLGNAQKVLGIEAVCAAQAIDLLAPLEPGPGTGAGLAVVRERTPTLERDRYLAPELEAAADAVATGRFAAIVREAAGSIGARRLQDDTSESDDSSGTRTSGDRGSG
jgi:histidine ammonia-lyase